MQLSQTLGQRLEQRMSQSQIQSLDLLAMPAAELRERIAAELTENPALERAADMRTQSVSPSRRETVLERRYGSVPDIYRRQPAGYFRQEHTGGSSEASDAFQAFLENIPAEQYATLQDRLLEQLYFCKLDSKTAAYAERIIKNLTPDGFHALPLAALFKQELSSGLPEERNKIRRALSLIRQFDPIGCGVRDFKQSLLIQAKLLFTGKTAADPVYGYTIDILEHHFSYLEKARPYSLVHAVNSDPSIPYKLTQETAEDILSLIASLNPFPGRTAGEDRTPDNYIIPTAFIEQVGDEFTVSINNFELPLLTVSPEFRHLSRNTGDKTAQRYIKEQVQRAKVFIGSLNQREKTIVSVLRCIVTAQEAFFLSGDKRRLVPLTQQSIAEQLGFHESTVSRTVSGKYLQCRWGIFEMKYFFTNALPVQPASAGAQEGAGTKEGVKACIQELLGTQTGKLSDQKISDMLAERYGISIARRTVAKYRKELAIASSYDR